MGEPLTAVKVTSVSFLKSENVSLGIMEISALVSMRKFNLLDGSKTQRRRLVGVIPLLAAVTMDLFSLNSAMQTGTMGLCIFALALQIFGGNSKYLTLQRPCLKRTYCCFLAFCLAY